MKKNVLLVYAHPEPTSITRQLVDVAAQTLGELGHEVAHSDLYGMRWKAVFDEHDFPERADPTRLSFIDESGHAYRNGLQTRDVQIEQEKLLAADAVILHFPLWWFGMPAILKGWVDRVWAYGLAYGYKGEGNRYRYGEGGFAGRRALLCVSVGGPEVDYSPRGINGPLDQLLFPITHGTLFFPGMQVLPTFALYGAANSDAQRFSKASATWRRRLTQLFEESPIRFRPQNAGDYPDRHVLANHLVPGQTGLMAHVGEPRERTRPPETTDEDRTTRSQPARDSVSFNPIEQWESEAR